MLPFIREISDPPPQYFVNPRDPQTNKNTHYVLEHKYILGPSQSSFEPSHNGSG